MRRIHQPTDTTIRRQLGAELAAARRKANLSLRDAAERAKMSHSHLYANEKGDANMSVCHLPAVARAVGTTAARLIRTIEP